MKGIKKILSITLASALIFGVCVFPASAVETDTSQPATVTLQGSLQPFEFNQWQRSYSDFSFDARSAEKMEKALTSAAITAATSALGALFGGGAGASIGGGAVGAFISSYAADAVSEYYEVFGNTGYGTVIGGRYGSKMRLAIYLYSDSARTNLVYSDVYATDHFPV